ncbi:MAG: acetolactate synthase small subunit [Chloroflexi bacterium]|nr:MAG: acetolactate synthase small subunit [Chloroflexota bacterium]
MSEKKLKRHTMIAWMENKPGVLNRVASLFRRRNFNIESLAVGHSETPGISRMTFVARGNERELRQVQTQLDKLIHVVDIQDVSDEPVVMRELALIKVRADNGSRAQVMQLVDIYRARVIDVDMDTLIVQIVGPEDRVQSFIKLLSNFGIEEMTRTGRVAMIRGPKSQKQHEVEEAVASYSNGDGQ